MDLEIEQIYRISNKIISDLNVKILCSAVFLDIGQAFNEILTFLYIKVQSTAKSFLSTKGIPIHLRYISG